MEKNNQNSVKHNEEIGDKLKAIRTSSLQDRDRVEYEINRINRLQSGPDVISKKYYDLLEQERYNMNTIQKGLLRVEDVVNELEKKKKVSSEKK